MADREVTFELPKAKDEHVQSIIGDLDRTLMLRQMVQVLSAISRYVNVSKNASAKNPSQIAKVQTSVFDAVKMCDAFGLVLLAFQSGAKNVLEKLHTGYLYLFDGFPDFARNDIEAISEDFKSMQVVVEKCSGVVDDAKMNFSAALNNIEKQHSEKERELQNNRERLDMMLNSRETAKSWTGTRYSAGTTGNMFVCSSFGRKFWFKFGLILLSGMVVMAIIYVSFPKRSSSSVRTWLAILDGALTTACLFSLFVFNLWRFGKQRSTTTRNFDDFHASLMENDALESSDMESGVTEHTILKQEMDRRRLLEEEFWLLSVAVCPLQIASPKFDAISTILRQSIQVVEAWCKENIRFVGTNVAKNIERVQELTAEEKEKYWNSFLFQKAVVNYFCRWRALQVYSEEVHDQLKEIQAEAESYYKENLFPDDAIRRAREVAVADRSLIGCLPDQSIPSFVI